MLQTAIVQTGPMQLSIDLFAGATHHDLRTDIQVKGVTCTKVRKNVLWIYDNLDFMIFIPNYYALPTCLSCCNNFNLCYHFSSSVKCLCTMYMYIGVQFENNTRMH